MVVRFPADHQQNSQFAPVDEYLLEDGIHDDCDSKAVEGLLSDKLVHGFVLLEKACPSCATPLVKMPKKRDTNENNLPEELDQTLSIVSSADESMGDNNVNNTTVVRPIHGVPYCVWCQAHVVTDESEVQELEAVSDKLKVRGTIMVDMNDQEDIDGDFDDDYERKESATIDSQSNKVFDLTLLEDRSTRNSEKQESNPPFRQLPDGIEEEAPFDCANDERQKNIYKTDGGNRDLLTFNDDDVSNEDYEEIEVVHIEDEDQTTFSELEQKILYGNKDNDQQEGGNKTAGVHEDKKKAMPSYNERREIAAKVLSDKVVEGFALTELQCNKCMMPLMEKDQSYFCVVCPVLKIKFKESLGSLGDELTVWTSTSQTNNASEAQRMANRDKSGSDVHHVSDDSSSQIVNRDGNAEEDLGMPLDVSKHSSPLFGCAVFENAKLIRSPAASPKSLHDHRATAVATMTTDHTKPTDIDALLSQRSLVSKLTNASMGSEYQSVAQNVSTSVKEIENSAENGLSSAKNGNSNERAHATEENPDGVLFPAVQYVVNPFAQLEESKTQELLWPSSLQQKRGFEKKTASLLAEAWDNSVVTETDYESKRDLVSKEIGKRMLRGWSLLQASCPKCTMPLMTDLDKRKEVCMLCGTVAEKASLSIASSAIFSSWTKERKVGDTRAESARIQAKKELIRQLVLEETKKAVERLKMQKRDRSGHDSESLGNLSTIATSKGDPASLIDDTGSSLGQLSIPDWLSQLRTARDTSASSVRSRSRNSVGGRIPVDPVDSHQESLGASAKSASTESVLKRESKGDPPAAQGYAVGRKQPIDVDESVVAVHSGNDQELTHEIDQDKNTSRRSKKHLTVNTRRRRAESTRATTSPGMSELSIPRMRVETALESPKSDEDVEDLLASNRWAIESQKKSERSRAVSSPGVTPMSCLEHCESPASRPLSEKNSDESHRRSSFAHFGPGKSNNRTYKTVQDTKKAIKESMAFLTRKSTQLYPTHKQTTAIRMLQNSGSEENSPVDADAAYADRIREKNNDSKASVASSRRPRRTPESIARNHLEFRRKTVSSLLANSSKPTSDSFTKMSSLTPSTHSVEILDTVDLTDYMQELTMDQVSQQIGFRTYAGPKAKRELSGVTTRSENILSRPSLRNAKSLASRLPSLPTFDRKRHSSQDVIFVGGPLSGSEIVDVSGYIDEDFFASSEESDEGVFGVSESCDEDISGSRKSELISHGSSTLDEVLARIDATARQLEQAPSGDSEHLRELIESLAEAAGFIEKEDRLDQHEEQYV